MSPTSIVFLHSLAGSPTHWQATIKALGTDYNCYALSLPGHGGTPPLRDVRLSVAAVADWVDRQLDTLGIPVCVLVGHSMGGSVAAACAARHPEKVCKLILVDPSGDSSVIPEAQRQGLLAALDSPGYQEVITGYWREILTEAQPSTIERVMADLGKMKKSVMMAYFAAVMSYRPVPDLETYPGAVQIIHAPVTDVPNGLHQLFPNIPSAKIDAVSHWLHLDRPAAFLGAFRQALQS